MSTAFAVALGFVLCIAMQAIAAALFVRWVVNLEDNGAWDGGEPPVVPDDSRPEIPPPPPEPLAPFPWPPPRWVPPAPEPREPFLARPRRWVSPPPPEPPPPRNRHTVEGTEDE